MPYFAADDRISEAAFEGAIEISKEQYQQAFDAMMAGGRAVIRGGALRILSAEQRRVYDETGAHILISVDDDVPEGYSVDEPVLEEPYEPSDLEIRLAALEAKTGVTKQDREAARHKLKGEK